MKTLRLALLFGLGLIAAPVAGDDAKEEKENKAVKEEMAKFQGEWSMVSGSADGQEMPEEMVKTAKRVCKDDETTVTVDGRVLMKAKFTIDPTKKPKSINYQMLEGFTKGKKQLGIYELDEDKLKACFAAPDAERPKDFTSKQGDHRTLSVWKRDKEEKTEAVTAPLAVYAADDKAKAQPPEAPASEIGEVRIRELAAVTYAYVATETTFDKLGEAIGAAMPQIQKASEDGKIKLSGPFVLTYPQGSAHLTPDKPFKVHIGLMASAESSGAGDVKVRKTEPFKAATVLYTGPVSGIGECYQKLFPAMERMGLEPTGEEREFTLYFEGVESRNNVVLVQVGVKARAEAQGARAELPRSGTKSADQGSSKAAAPPNDAKTARDPAAGETPKAPELQVLDRYVGTWDGSVTLKPGPWIPQEVKQTDVGVFKWVLGGRFLQISSSSPTNGEGLHMMTYDADRKAYRHWFFHSLHGASEASGKWDEKSQTFTWKGDGPPGMTSTTTDRWVGADKREWSYTINESDGKLMFELQATSTRRK